MLACGTSMGWIAAELASSAAMVDNRSQHNDARIGVATRAGATLVAMGQGPVTDE